MASASSYSTLVQELYVAYFGRPADYFGLQNFEAALAAASAPTTIAGLEAAYSTNAAVKTLIDSFGTSAESTALYGSGTTESFVTAIFENLLNRAPAVAGLSFWVNAINSGAVTKGDAALAIAAGAQANTTAQGLIDAQTIANKLTVAANFTTDLGASSLDIVAYSGHDAATAARGLIAAVGSSTDTTAYQATVQTSVNAIVAAHINNTYNLTTGVDSIVGGPGNSLINAVLDNAAGIAAGGQASTLNSFDTITGGTLNNTLSITDFGLGGQMVLPTSGITNITTVNINSLEGLGTNTGANALDLSALGTLTNVNVNASNGYDYVKVGTNTTLVLNDSAADNVYTYGGSTVTVKNAVNGYTEVAGGAATTAVNVTGNDTEIYDLHSSQWGGLTAGTNTLATVSLTNNTDYAYVYSDALTSLTLTNSDNTFIGVYSAAGTRALTLDLVSDVNTSKNYTEVQDDTATSITVAATGTASNNLYLHATSAASLTFNDAVDLSFYQGTVAGSGTTYLHDAAAKAVTITGAGAFTADLSGLNAGAVVNASGSTGVVTVELASASGGALTQSFTGGSGQDIVTVGAGQTGSVSGGSAANNEIVLSNISGATAAALAPYTHFSILGVTGSTSGVFDMSKAAGYKSFDVQGSGSDVTFTNAATGSSISLENGNSHIITLQTVDTTGGTDSVTINLGTASAVHNTYTQVTVEDSNFVGTATVNLVSNVSDTSNGNVLTKLGDNNLVTLNLSGTGFLNINTAITDVSTSVTINNALTASSSSSAYIAGLTDNYLTTLTFGGTQGTNVNTLTSTATSLTIVDNDAAAVSITNFADTSLTSATFTNSVNTTAATFHVGSSAITEVALATLTLNGNVAVGITGDNVSSGITVTGGTDNAAVDFTSVGATATGKVDSITLGNGAADHVILGTGVATSTQTVVLGSGANDLVSTTSLGAVNVTVGSSTAGTDSITADSASTVHVTAGNGTDVISATAASASITIAVGTGANSVTVGANSSGTISFGAHTGTDTVSVGVSGTSLTAIEKISGLNNATTDTITFSGDATALTGFTQVTAGAVVGSGGNTTLLTSWVAAADGAAGSSVTGAAHGITWFQFQGNTYILESVAGATADAGTMVAGNTLVELTGTGYTFAHATGAGGVLHLLG